MALKLAPCGHRFDLDSLAADNAPQTQYYCGECGWSGDESICPECGEEDLSPSEVVICPDCEEVCLVDNLEDAE